MKKTSVYIVVCVFLTFLFVLVSLLCRCMPADMDFMLMRVYPFTRSNGILEYLRPCGWQVGAVCVGLCDEQSQVGGGLFEVKLWNPDEWVRVVSCGQTWTSPQRMWPTRVAEKNHSDFS